MIISQYLYPMLGVATMAAMVAKGADTVSLILDDPLIEGVGVYSEPVHPGELVLVNWTVTKRTECPGVTSRAWFGERGFQLTEPMQATSLPIGTAVYKIQTRVPSLAPPGDLELRIVGRIECLGVAPIGFNIGPVAFDVVDNTGDGS